MTPRSSKSKWLRNLTNSQKITLLAAIVGGICAVIAACIGLGVPIISRLLEPSLKSQTDTPFISSSSTDMSTPTQSNDLIRLTPISLDRRGCHAPMFAVPKSLEIPPPVVGDDPFERFSNTFNFLNGVGIPVAPKSINDDGISGDDLHRWASPCEPSIGLGIVLWNNLASRILVKEFVLIVESYDYEPSKVPSDYQLVFLIPPDLYIGPRLDITPSPMPTKIPYQFFNHELKATSNSLPFLNLSNTPPIIIEPNTPMSFSVNLWPVAAGTFRTHLAFYIEDNQGNQIKLNSESIVTKWIVVESLKAVQAIPIDVK